MTMLARLRLKHKILLAALLPIVLFTIATWVAVVAAGDIREAQDDVVRAASTEADARTVETSFLEMVAATRGFVASGDEDIYASHGPAHEAAKTALDRLEEDSESDPRIAALAREARSFVEDYHVNQSQPLATIVRTNGSEAALTAWRSGGAVTVATSTRERTNDITELTAAQRAEANARTAAALDRLLLATIGGTVAAAALAIALATFIASRTSHSIHEAIAGLSSSSAEIAATVEQHERTAAQQAASVNETTATMEELDASARQSDEQATAAAEAAKESLRLTEDGTQQVAETSKGMTATRERVEAISKQILRLSEQVEQIGNVTSVVSDLGSQVHMLALNAAVEASRAGEHGRGFAVVAAEIRKLADQSRRSAERISGLVADIQKATNATVMVTEEGTKTVEQGLTLAQKTAKAFESVAGSANVSYERSQQISLTAKQQAAAVRQVVEAMSSINQGARETVEGINQTKLGLRQVNQSAEKLRAMV